jgi:hypothetical protein
MPVKVPDGCLLVQAGKQLEWFSGGLVKGTSPIIFTQNRLLMFSPLQPATMKSFAQRER